MAPDGISGQMLLLCDQSVLLPLKIIFHNILETAVYPDMWKVANVTQIETSVYPDMWKVANVIPIDKKENKMFVKIYRAISLLPICGKICEKSIFNHLHSYMKFYLF